MSKSTVVEKESANKTAKAFRENIGERQLDFRDLLEKTKLVS